MLRQSLFAILLLIGSERNAHVLSDALARSLQKANAEVVLNEYFDDEKKWSSLLASIATGRRAWLGLAVRLGAVADGGAGEQIELAVGEALEHRPENVLTIAVPAMTITVCGGPDLDDARYDSYGLSIAAIDLRKRMLATVTQPNLRALRNACIQELEASKTGIARFYGHEMQ